MTHRFFLPDLPRGGSIELPAAEAKHAASVLRLQSGAVIELFDGAGRAATCTLEQVTRGRVSGTIHGFALADRRPAAAVTLIVALPKGDRSRTLVEKATELGVERIVPLRCQRSVVQPKPTTLDRLRRTVIEACKQSGRNRLMQIDRPIDFAELLKPSEPSGGEPPRRSIAHPGDAPATSLTPAAAHHIVIGPEGGFTDDEFASAVAAGWHPISLGPHILRIETAAIAAAAIASNAATS